MHHILIVVFVTCGHHRSLFPSQIVQSRLEVSIRIQLTSGTLIMVMMMIR